MPEAPKTLNTFEALVQVISALRGPWGCPWDQEQTHQSLAPYVIEESFELVEALESQNLAHMCEELGDVLFQVILHASMAEEKKAFTIYDVIEKINQKVVRRHPHVFSNSEKKISTEEVLKNWDAIKKLEKKNSASPTKVIDVPVALPSLQRAHKIGEKTKKFRFDWTEVKDVLQQLKAEIQELEDVMNDPASVEKAKPLQHEMGDVLFSAAQLARHLNLEPEASLREANARFIRRFEKMLHVGSCSIEVFTDLPPAEKEELWKKAKQAD